jgi:hypothetical protein
MIFKLRMMSLQNRIELTLACAFRFDRHAQALAKKICNWRDHAIDLHDLLAPIQRLGPPISTLQLVQFLVH